MPYIDHEDTSSIEALSAETVPPHICSINSAGAGSVRAPFKQSEDCCTNTNYLTHQKTHGQYADGHHSVESIQSEEVGSDLAPGR